MPLSGHPIGSSCHAVHEISGLGSSWPLGIAPFEGFAPCLRSCWPFWGMLQRLPFEGCLVEAGVLPSRWFCCPPFTGIVTPSDFLPPLPLFGFSLIAASLLAGRISQVACKAFPAFRSPYAGGLAPLAPDSSAGSWPSPVDTRLGILLHLSVSHSRRGRIHLMLRTAGWFPH